MASILQKIRKFNSRFYYNEKIYNASKVKDLMVKATPYEIIEKMEFPSRKSKRQKSQDIT